MRWLGAMVDGDKVKEGKVGWVPNKFLDSLEKMMTAKDNDELDEGGVDVA
jgi:hypothetical protein